MTQADHSLPLVALLRRLAQLEATVADLSAEDSLGFSSQELEDGLAQYFDEDGNVRMDIGIQQDGRFTIKHHGGSPPPKPTSPDCDPVVSGVRITYDGTFEDDEDVPSDLDHYDIHASPTPDFTADDTNMVGTLFSADGGTFVHGIITPHQPWYYAIVAVDHAGNESVKSDEVACKSGGIRGYQDEATASGPGTLHINLTYRPMPDSTIHVYWNGVEQPDNTWTYADYVITVADSGDFLEAGDLLVAKYLYFDPEPRPVIPGTVELVAEQFLDNNVTSVPLPDGTVEGDILCLTMQTGGFGSVPACSDPRITTHQVLGHLYVGVGVADATTSDIAVSIGDGEHNGRVELTSYRITGTAGTPEVSTASSGVFNPTMPSGSPAAAIMALSTAYLGGAGREIGTSPQSDWERGSETISGSNCGETWFSNGGADAISLTPGSLTSWVAIVIGVG